MLAHGPEAAGQARRAVWAVLGEWGVGGEAADAVVLVVCELVTNSVEHAVGPLLLCVDQELDGVRVEVSDGGPAASEGAWTASCSREEHGRGLDVVRALSTELGTSQDAGGRVTHWARLAVPAA